MDIVIYSKILSIKDEVTSLCTNLRNTYYAYKSKQTATSTYATTALSKANASNVKTSIIKSVQRGSATAAGTVTINEVDTAKCLVLSDDGFNGATRVTAFRSYNSGGAKLTSSTELTVTMGVNNLTVNWQVIEFY